MLVKIPIDPVLVSIGGLKIHWYGIMIAIGLYVGIQVALRDSPRRGIDRDQLMNVALLAIQNAGDKGNDRQAVIDQFFKIKNRDSVLGKYSIDQNGDTTLSDYGGDKVKGGATILLRVGASGVA